MTKRILLHLLVLAGAFASARECVSVSDPKVTARIEEKFGADGIYTFTIFEQGVGSSGEYTRSYWFIAPVRQGLCIPSEFKEYKSILKTVRTGTWETHREPVAGYCLIFFRSGRLYVDLRLVELLDQHPVPLAANGIHLLYDRTDDAQKQESKKQKER